MFIASESYSNVEVYDGTGKYPTLNVFPFSPMDMGSPWTSGVSDRFEKNLKFTIFNPGVIYSYNVFVSIKTKKFHTSKVT